MRSRGRRRSRSFCYIRWSILAKTKLPPMAARIGNIGRIGFRGLGTAGDGNTQGENETFIR
ncbi:hypothetical protein PCH70_39330 [Pseudomonas cichorii JBC1]|nr:hypothetical protein PCH70_39330 [Pseudomonas cichorii JBC1]